MVAFCSLLGRVTAGDRASVLAVALGDIGQSTDGKRELRASHGSGCGRGRLWPAHWAWQAGVRGWNSPKARCFSWILGIMEP